MAKDPAVSSIEVDCLQRADMSLPESDHSSPGDHDMDQVEAVARRLSVQAYAPWGLDRIDTSGEPAVRSWWRPQPWLAAALPSAPPLPIRWRSYRLSPPSHPRRLPSRQVAGKTANTTTAT